MSRLAPKFAVGEAVLVRPKIRQSFHATVLAVRETTPFVISEDTGEILPQSFAYRLTDGYEWHECALHKKPDSDHTPSTESFDQLLQGLKRPQNAKISEGA